MGEISSGSKLKRRYRLERLLGTGGMAAVWLGHDDVLDRPARAGSRTERSRVTVALIGRS